jgi:type IV secretion system protein VirD4
MMRVAIKAAIFLVTVVVLALALDWLAGAILYLMYRQSPFDVRFTTLLQAWQLSATEPLLRGRVVHALAAAMLGCLVVGGGLIGAVLELLDRRPLYGAARFANRRELRKAGLLQSEGLILGRHQGRLLRLDGPEFVLLSAPTRSGKGVSFVIPNLLTWPQSVVVLDIKGENYDLTAGARLKSGSKVYRFSPFEECSHGCNFLGYVSDNPAQRISDLQGMAAIIYPNDAKNPFWAEQARNLFLGMALLVFETSELPHTLGELVRQASGKGEATESYLQKVMALRHASDQPFSPTCIDTLNRFLTTPEETRRNILASFLAPLGVFANPIVDKATSRQDFDLRRVRIEPMSIYVTIPPNQIAQAGFILNLFFSTLIDQNIQTLPSQDSRLRLTCLLLMDEFTAAGRIVAIEKGVAFMAGYNLRLALVIQDQSQLEQDAAYGRAGARNILANMGAVVSFSPRTDEDGERLSRMIGYQTVIHRQRQRRSKGLAGGAVSEQEGSYRRALMLPQELRALDQTELLIQRPGIPMVRARKISYFSDRDFSWPACRAEPPATMAPRWVEYRADIIRSDFYLNHTMS